MEKKLQALREQLFSANGDGVVICNCIIKIRKLINKGCEPGKAVLAEYMLSGLFHWDFACSTLAQEIKEPSAEFAAVFQKNLAYPGKCYWNILGYINSAGRQAYNELVKLALDSNYTLSERSHAVKCLARHSKQRFDRGLTSDPGHWKITDLRLDELKAWAETGYPEGEGYCLPARDPALDQPSTPLEMIVSRWDKKLGRLRQRTEEDPANPFNRLVVADLKEIEKIKQQWTLPAIYLDFISRFSPLVNIENRRFYNGGLSFTCAHDAIEIQEKFHHFYEGYPGWHNNLFVIGEHALDVFALDLSQSNGEDAPIYKADHDGDRLKKEAPSFMAFLEKVTK